MSANLHVKIIRGSNLLKMDVGKSDPYVVVSINGKDPKCKTQAISNTLNPEWNQEFDLVSKKPEEDSLYIEMFDEDLAKDDTMCDRIKIKVSEIPKDGSVVAKQEKLKLKKKKDAGILEFEVSATPGPAVEDDGKKKKSKSKDKKKDKDDSSSSKDKKKSKDKKHRKNSSSEADDKKKEKPIPPTKYKLNIRCEKAEKIPKSDLTKSDPYAVFNLDGYSVKAQTNYIENNLNPEWNEDLALDGYALSEDVLCVAVWDKDLKKDDKLCGCEVALRSLPPGHVVTKTYELYKFDKKGKLDKKKKAGKIKLGLQVSRESDTPFEQIEWEYPVYVANIHIVQCQDVPPMDIKNSDPYCVLTFNNDSKKSKTKVIDNNLNPQWDEKFHWYYEDNSVPNTIHVTLWDKDVSKDDQISKLDIDVSKCDLGTIYEYSQTMLPVGNVKAGGQLSYRIHVTKVGEKAFDDENVENDGLDEECYELHLKICQAQDIIKSDADATDGYVKVTVDNNEQKASTKPKKNTLNPVWNEVIQWKPCYEDSKVSIELWDKDLMKDDHIDDLEIDMTNYPLGTVYKGWFDFQKKGKIELWIHLAKPGQTPFDGDKNKDSSSSMNTCSFSWGSYSSSKYSTDFHGYTKGESLSSLSSSEEKKIVHKHEIKEKKHKEHKTRKDCILKIIGADGLFVPEACKGAIQPYVTACVVGRNNASKTSVKKDTVTPEWNEELHVKKVEASDSIELTIFDKNKILRDQPLGYVQIPLAEIYDNDSEVDNTYDLVKPPKMSDEIAAFVQNGFGHIHVAVSFK